MGNCFHTNLLVVFDAGPEGIGFQLVSTEELHHGRVLVVGVHQ